MANKIKDPRCAAYWVGKTIEVQKSDLITLVTKWANEMADEEFTKSVEGFINAINRKRDKLRVVSVLIDSLDVNEGNVHASYFTLKVGEVTLGPVSLEDDVYPTEVGDPYLKLHAAIYNEIKDYLEERDDDDDEPEFAKDDEFKPTYRELNNGGKSILVDYYSPDNIIVHSEDFNKLELIGILYQAIQKLSSNEQEA